MNQSDFKALVDETVRTTAAILVAKGEEYAGSSDRLANFKRGASSTGTTPLQVAFIYASKHYDSIATYVRKDAEGFEQVLSEPIEGRFDDLINYCFLMKALVREAADFKNYTQQKPQQPKETSPTIPSNLNKPYRDLQNQQLSQLSTERI